MKLYVKNLCAVKKGELELDGITVIAGQNGVGKSTIGKILYCISRAYGNDYDNLREETQGQIFRVISECLRNSKSRIGDVAIQKLSSSIYGYYEDERIIHTIP